MLERVFMEIRGNQNNKFYWQIFKSGIYFEYCLGLF